MPSSLVKKKVYTHKEIHPIEYMDVDDCVIIEASKLAYT